MSSAKSYKQEHEEFVSGHHGSTFLEVSLVIGVSCSLCILRDLLSQLSHENRNHERQKGQRFTFFSSSTCARFFLDFAVLAVPSLLLVTLLGPHVHTVALLVFTAIACLVWWPGWGLFRSCPSSPWLGLGSANLDQHNSFLTYFRSTINLLTATCILAVDFPVFPRCFAKAETYGYGLMDTGVGFFVISNAVVSPEARGRQEVGSRVTRIGKAIKSSVPLIILAFLRLLAVKGTNYHEHVTEYGVHWNFFFTLAAVKIGSSLLFSLPNLRWPAFLGLVLSGVHQTWLYAGGSDYLVHGLDGQGGRSGLLDANREGVVSLPGYLAIYLIGVALGRFLFQKRSSLQDWLVAALHLSLVFLVTATAAILMDMWIEPVSRRFVNTAYVFWITNQSCLALTICLAADVAKVLAQHCNNHNTVTLLEKSGDSRRVTRSMAAKTNQMPSHNAPATQQSPSDSATGTKQKPSQDSSDPSQLPSHNAPATQQSPSDSATGTKQKPSQDTSDPSQLPSHDAPSSHEKPRPAEFCLLEAIAFNALLFFLLANLLTGLVNFSMSTIRASSTVAMATLSCYLLALSVTVACLHHRHLSTKIW